MIQIWEAYSFLKWFETTVDFYKVLYIPGGAVFSINSSSSPSQLVSPVTSLLVFGSSSSPWNNTLKVGTEKTAGSGHDCDNLYVVRYLTCCKHIYLSKCFANIKRKSSSSHMFLPFFRGSFFWWPAKSILQNAKKKSRSTLSAQPSVQRIPVTERSGFFVGGPELVFEFFLGEGVLKKNAWDLFFVCYGWVRWVNILYTCVFGSWTFFQIYSPENWLISPENWWLEDDSFLFKMIPF